VEFDGLAPAVPLVQLAGRLVPADVGQHEQAQEAGGLACIDHLADEAVFAAGEFQQVGQQRVEDLVGRGCPDEP